MDDDEPWVACAVLSNPHFTFVFTESFVALLLCLHLMSADSRCLMLSSANGADNLFPPLELLMQQFTAGRLLVMPPEIG